MAKNKIPYYSQTPKFGSASQTGSTEIALTTLLTAGAEDMKVKSIMGSLALENDAFDDDGAGVRFDIIINDGGGDDTIAKIFVSNKIEVETSTGDVATVVTKALGAGLKHGTVNILELMTGSVDRGFNLPAGFILKVQTVNEGAPSHDGSSVFAAGEDY